MKFRHGTVIPGSLVNARSGHIHDIVVSGLATPPDTDGSNTAPLYWYNPSAPYAHGYAHGGVQLTNAAGKREFVPYSSWTEAPAGVFTFTVNYTLNWSYAIGDVAGPVNVSFLRNVNGHHLTPITAYPKIQLAGYTDGDINLSACGYSSSSNRAWDGSLTPGDLSGIIANVYWKFRLTGYSISGKSLTNGFVAIQHFRQSSTTDRRWKLTINRSIFTSVAWQGYTADCQNSSPCGIYTQTAGCATSPSALTIEPVP